MTKLLQMAETGYPSKYDKPKVRVPIRTKIIFPYLFLAALLALGASYLITQIVFDSLEERFTNQLIETGKISSEWMVREEKRILETINLVANTTGIHQAISGRDAERLRELTYGIAVDKQEEAIEILDQQGYLLLSMHHKTGGKIEEYDFARDGDQFFAGWEFVGKVLQYQPDEYSDKYSGLIAVENSPYFYIAAPIIEPDGKLVGAVLVGKSLQRLVQEIRKETLSQVTIYDFSGKVLMSTFVEPLSLPGISSSTVIANQDASSLLRSVGEMRELESINIEYGEILGPWEARQDEDLGIVGTSLPKTFLVSPNRVTRWQITLLVGASLMLIIMLGTNLARLITRPLLDLVQASVQVAHGDLQVQLEPNTNDEVAILTDSFNVMVNSLQESKDQLLHAYDSTLLGWSKALEMRDKETEGHTLRVTQLTVELARKLAIGGDDLVQIQRGALLHDIGKMGIPDHILLKPGKLDDEEWVMMRKHPEFAYEMLYPIEYLRPALDIPYYHHERWDGKGYPTQIKGADIPIGARIFAVVDVWDALTSERPYKKAWEPKDALAEIKAQSGKQFDPTVVEVFLSHIHEAGTGKQERVN